MQKMRKRIKITAIVLTLGLLATNTAYASSELAEATVDTLLASSNPHDHIKALEIMELNGAQVSKETINEFDALKNLNDELTIEGTTKSADYSGEELNYITNYRNNLIEKIERMQNESDDVLKDYNYTDDQIEAIRYFDGSDELLRRAASRCTVYGGFNNYTASSSGSSAQLVAAFEWNGSYSPGNPLSSNDIFGVTWSAPFTERSATGHLVHRNSSYNNTIQSNASVSANDIYVSSIRVPNNRTASVSGAGIIGHWINSGSIISQISSNSYAPDLAGYAAYGLSTLTISPSVSLGGGAGAGLSFSSGVRNVGSSRFYP